MTKRIFLFVIPLLWLILAGLPAAGQQKLYPVTKGGDVPAVLTPDHSGIVVEKAFQYKLSLGFPTGDSTIFIPQTETPMVMLWLKIQNISANPLEINISKFTSMDDQGQVYPALALDEAFTRILAGFYGATNGSKTVKTLTLGHIANIPSQEEFKANLQRYSLQPGQVPSNILKEGWIYFEKPPRKKFTVTVKLGDLSSQPLVFSTEKQK
jgi:hypothetical protein